MEGTLFDCIEIGDMSYVLRYMENQEGTFVVLVYGLMGSFDDMGDRTEAMKAIPRILAESQMLGQKLNKDDKLQ